MRSSTFRSRSTVPGSAPAFSTGRHAPVARPVRASRRPLRGPARGPARRARGAASRVRTPASSYQSTPGFSIADRAEARLDHLHADAAVEQRLLGKRDRDRREAALLVGRLERVARRLDVAHVARLAEVGLQDRLDLARRDQRRADDLVGLDLDLGPWPTPARQLEALVDLDRRDGHVLRPQRLHAGRACARTRSSRRRPPPPGRRRGRAGSTPAPGTPGAGRGGAWRAHDRGNARATVTRP